MSRPVYALACCLACFKQVICTVSKTWQESESFLPVLFLYSNSTFLKTVRKNRTMIMVFVRSSGQTDIYDSPLKKHFFKKFYSEFDSLCKLLLSYVLVIAPPEC